MHWVFLIYYLYVLRAPVKVLAGFDIRVKNAGRKQKIRAGLPLLENLENPRKKLLQARVILLIILDGSTFEDCSYSHSCEI